MKNWIMTFVEEWRLQANSLSEEDKECFKPYVKEQMLSMPCQIEAVEFRNPYRLVLLFFFDEDRSDLSVTVQKRKWTDLSALVDSLCAKYSKLRMEPTYLWEELFHYKHADCDDIDYGVGCLENVCIMFFSREPRIWALSVAWFLERGSGPSSVGRSIFRLNYSQAVDYYRQEEILRDAVKDLTGEKP